MEVEKEEIIDNPDMFLTPDEQPPKKTKEIEAAEMNPLTIKENEYLVIGIYGNGSGLVKSALFNEMKQANCFKIKFLQNGSNPSARKVLLAELYQVTSNGKNILILLIKTSYSPSQNKNIINYFKTNGITFKEIICFDALNYKSILGTQPKENTTYLLKSKNSPIANNVNGILPLPLPNTIQGFSAYVLCWADFNDLPCVVYISVISHYDIGLESVEVFSLALKDYDFLNNKTSDEYLKSQKIEKSMIKSVFNEFNSIKQSYFS